MGHLLGQFDGRISVRNHRFCYLLAQQTCALNDTCDLNGLTHRHRSSENEILYMFEFCVIGQRYLLLPAEWVGWVGHQEPRYCCPEAETPGLYLFLQNCASNITIALTIHWKYQRQSLLIVTASLNLNLDKWMWKMEPMKMILSTSECHPFDEFYKSSVVFEGSCIGNVLQGFIL